MIANPLRALATWLVVASATAVGQEPPTLRARAELDPGPRYVGESFELRLSVVAGGEEPTLTLPALDHARLAVVETFIRPLQASGIGKTISLEQLYLFQLRVVADAPGTLEIPPVEVGARGRIGRSRPTRIEIKPVPSDGRPAEFLGGVGRFEIEAQAQPSVVRVGEPIVYKIKATGPGALGMVDRPSLARFERLAIPVEIRKGRDLTSFEPPSRIFVYEIRLLSAGEIVLPPVSVATFDPAVKRYLTHATHGLPLRGVAAPVLDSSAIAVTDTDKPLPQSAWYALGSMSLGLIVALAFAAWKSWRPRTAKNARAARRHAARVARRLRAPITMNPAHADQIPRALMDDLGRYLALGLGRPMGALSPEDARTGVAEAAASTELGDHAARLANLCDRWIYGPEDARPVVGELQEDARHLFQMLGQARRAVIRGAWMKSAPRTFQVGSDDPGN